KSAARNKVIRSIERCRPRRHTVTGFEDIEHDILTFSLGSLSQRQRRRTLDVSAETVGYDLDDRYSRVRNAHDATVVLPDVVTRQHAVDQAVFTLYEPVVAPLQLQRADHTQRVEGELLEEFAWPLRIRSHRVGDVATDWRAGHERRAQRARLINKGLVRLDLRQRLDSFARTILDLLDLSSKLLHVACTAAQEKQHSESERNRSDD